MWIDKQLMEAYDKRLRPQVRVLGRSSCAFHFWGVAGLALAILVAIPLAVHDVLSLAMMTLITVVAVLTFFALVMATKIVTGKEQIIYYHHEIAVMVVAALLLWLLGQPLLPYLDLTILGIGVFLACGRVGCLMVGCCHGRPHHWGVRYRKEHAAVGFTPYYVGVRLFPIQLVESLWVLCIVTVGSFFVLRGDPPGTALAWYVVVYGLGRFFFEFMRGDPDRPYLWGYSQPQWISLVLPSSVVGAELSGVLPFHVWHSAAVMSMMLAMIAIGLNRPLRKTWYYRLVHPHHVKEIAHAIELASSSATETVRSLGWTIFPKADLIQREIPVACTSLGVQLSANRIRLAGDRIDHFAISHRDGEMTETTARILARLIFQLKGATEPSRFLNGNHGVFHLLIHSVGERGLERR